ncbi:5-formyltetrahydrofolate cyclo-ligase [Paludibacter sp.]
MFKFLTNFFKTLFFSSEGQYSIEAQKAIIRRSIKTQRSELTDAYKTEQSLLVFEKIEEQAEFKQAKSVLMYWSLNDELPTHDFIKKWNRTKTILLPVVKGNHMTIRPFISEDKLLKSDFNILEPKSGQDYLKTVDLAIIPGVAFDRKKKRLGRGKGYYDRYLNKKRIPKWGICFDFQLYDKIPTKNYDIKMDKVITPSETIE